MAVFRLFELLAWTLWYATFGLVKGIESLVLGHPVDAVMSVLHENPHAFFAAAVTGAGFSVLWVAWAVAPGSGVSPGTVCTAYMCVMVYLLSCVIAGTLVRSCARRRYRAPSAMSWAPFLVLPGAGHLGMLLGMSLAYSVASQQTAGAGDTAPDEEWHEWCRPHESVPIHWLMLGAAAAAFGGTVVSLPTLQNPEHDTPPAPPPRDRHRVTPPLLGSSSEDDADDEEAPQDPSVSRALKGMHRALNVQGTRRAH